MNRRKFLAWLGGTAAGVALAPILDIDKLLWIPGEKKIFVPAIQIASVADMQRMVNYYRSCAVEVIGLSTKSPWMRITS